MKERKKERNQNTSSQWQSLAAAAEFVGSAATSPPPPPAPAQVRIFKQAFFDLPILTSLFLSAPEYDLSYLFSHKQLPVVSISLSLDKGIYL